MDPDIVRQWQRIFRDTLLNLCGVFLFVYGATEIHDPTALGIVLGTGLGCFSAPPLLRLRLDRPTDDDKENGS